jgi:hypothetical protein
MDSLSNKRLPVVDSSLAPILLAVVLAFTLFSQSPPGFPNANVKSRMYLTLSILEDGVININRFHAGAPSVDVAQIGDNYYSDKAPGMSFTSLPVAALGRTLLQLTGQPTTMFDAEGGLTDAFVFVTYLSQVATSGLGVVLLLLALYRVALRLGANRSAATFGVIVCALTTPLWGWATAFFGHAFATSLLFIGFALLVELEHSGARKKDLWLSFGVGLCLAWAFVVEFTTAPASLIVGIYGVYRIRTSPKDRIVRCVLAAVAGCVLAAIPLLLYNAAAFGSAFKLGYSNVVGFEGMQTGFFGINAPRLHVLVQILVGERRGLAWLSPILVAAPFALLVMWNDHRQRASATVIAAVTVYYLLMNSGYHYWDGGYSTGPRHLTPTIPFLALSLVFLWARAGKLVRSLLIVLSVVSYGISLVCVSMTMMVGERMRQPLREYLFPSFSDWLLHGETPILGVAHVPFWFGVPPILTIPALVFVTVVAVVDTVRRLHRRSHAAAPQLP